ncbi:MAG: hypothetical protein KC589_06710 [Nanoarchaeota archaeon]|nr:hypothetical protein [Nanoarchaeota archaeon]MCA9496611.1 hypothetical protein [Nanoarchaeota archaeon]
MVKTNLSNEEFKEASELTETQMKELVDKYTKLRGTIEILEKESEEVKSKLVEYALFKEQDELQGTHRTLTVNKYETFAVPPKAQSGPLIQYLKKKEYWNIFTELDKNKLIKAIKEKKFNDIVLEELSEFVEPKTIYRLVFDKKE